MAFQNVHDTIHGLLEAFNSIELFEQAHGTISILREIDIREDDKEWIVNSHSHAYYAMLSQFECFIRCHFFIVTKSTAKINVSSRFVAGFTERLSARIC